MSDATGIDILQQGICARSTARQGAHAMCKQKSISMLSDQIMLFMIKIMQDPQIFMQTGKPWIDAVWSETSLFAHVIICLSLWHSPYHIIRDLILLSPEIAFLCLHLSAEATVHCWFSLSWISLTRQWQVLKDLASLLMIKHMSPHTSTYSIYRTMIGSFILLPKSLGI